MEPALQNLQQIADAISDTHKNIKVTEVNQDCVRLAVNVDRTFPWHFHPASDEWFLVLAGELQIEFQDGTRPALRPSDSLLVKAGVIHRTHAVGRTVNLCFEGKGAETVFEV